jgi:uncharacterized protein (TIRG00374 family)
VGFIISAVAVWFSMRDVRPAEVWDALRQANYFGFVIVSALTLVGFWIRAFRWRWLLSKPVRIGRLFSATMIGFMANNLLPLRLGEFVRAWALGRSENIPKSTVFATVVVERVLDMLTLLAVLAFSLAVHPLGESTEAGKMVRGGSGVLVMLGVALTVTLVVVERNPVLMKRLIAWVTGFAPKRVRGRLQAALENFLQGLVLFRNPGTLVWVMFVSLVMWSMYALALHVSLWALGIQAPWYAGIVMLVVTAIGIMVPAAPGYIGTLNLACVAGLALFGVGKDQSVPFSWFYWLSQWLPISLVGLYYLRREGLTLKSIGSAGDSPS